MAGRQCGRWNGDFFVLFGHLYEKTGVVTSLQNLLSKEDKLILLLKASAEKAQASVEALVATCGRADEVQAAQDLAYYRVADRRITDEIRGELYGGLEEPIEREEIERLSKRLYKIPKLANKFRERLLASPDFVRAVDFGGQLKHLREATAVVAELVGCLQGRLDLERVQALNERLQMIEGEADKHMLALYKELFSGKYNAGQVVVLKDLYEMLERMVDRNRDAGNLILLITLSNS
jgi:uncharacterized protein